MIHVSIPVSTPPSIFRSALQQEVYATLAELKIPFLRVDNDPAITMEECKAIDTALGVHTAKTILLTNRQKTLHYLFVTPGDKPFSTRDFGQALGVPRVSFAPADTLMEMLGTPVGAATVLSLVADTSQRIRTVIDSDVLAEPWFGCPDGTTTGYMKLRTSDVTDIYIPHTGHTAEVITV